MYVNRKSNKRKRLKKHGFLSRILKSANVLKRRRAKGRKRLTVSDTAYKF